MQFCDIPRFPYAYYEVDIPWKWLESSLSVYQEMGLDLDPDFQRQHVWTESQQQAFVEYSLRGGQSARHIYFNAVRWREGKGPIQLIDGKQRLQAARKFMANELAVFGGNLCHQMGDFPNDILLRFHVHRMSTRLDVLNWYLSMNAGGSVHTKEELNRVRTLISIERVKMLRETYPA